MREGAYRNGHFKGGGCDDDALFRGGGSLMGEDGEGDKGGCEDKDGER